MNCRGSGGKQQGLQTGQKFGGQADKIFFVLSGKEKIAGEDENYFLTQWRLIKGY